MKIFGLFAKYPVPGSVKTRLASALGPERATAVYAAFVSDIVSRFRRVADRRVIGFSPDNAAARDYFAGLAGDDYDLWPQPDSDLGGRMAEFFVEHLQPPCLRTVLIGSDTPTLPYEYVEWAFELLQDADCVLGPATDGGYYLVGLRECCRPIFGGITWSGPSVLDQTVRRIEETGVRLALLPPWYDVDTRDDLRMLQGHVRAMRSSGKCPTLDATSVFLTEP